ncbi:hypothetical protein [uncultured Tateyamaria sp.]|uniref:hypothetical protein n=1 Tax=uncultured Tateyamaria sp. TaxID=455651 RepID=UPI0026262B9D|nr:hypothetical protein [uncultured Tateyamaria sp.]
MIRALSAASAVALAMVGLPAVAQDANQAPPPGPAANTTPPPAEGQLLGGTLTPAAGVAALGVGIAIIALSSDSSGTTTTTTTP